ncbi:MAG: BamA/TamA family outer membrane protein [Candidatus Krumholzibacteria bacterium]|nr:BamA/TamA family outer membrane protein [Candidatus Krumholzibacteria bacterium]
MTALTPSEILRLAPILVMWLAGMAAPLAAQDELVQSEAEQAEAIKELESRRNFVAAPIPIVNPTLGEGLGAIAMYLYKMDEESQSSYTGAGVLYTSSESWGVGVAQALFFNEDAWKLKAGVAFFDLNLDFFGIGSGAGDQGISVPVNQKGWGGGLKALRRIKGHWYAGLKYSYVKIDSTFDLTDPPPGDPIELPPVIELDSVVAGLGIVGEYDSRDDQFNAYKGNHFEFLWSVADQAVGSDFDFQSVKTSYNLYRGIGNQKIIAARFMGCAAPGDAPYYALCSFGQGVDLRGYVGGRYRDVMMFATQAEYRWRFYKRWGMVAFAGVGEVADSLSDFNAQNLLPSVGAGIRFMLSEDHRLNLSVDWARGMDDDAWYFYVSESF